MASASWDTVARGRAIGTPAVSQFAGAVGVALLMVAAGCVIYLTERWSLPNSSRFAEQPLELMVRCLGLSHFLVGWLFLATSPRIRGLGAMGRLLLGMLAGGAICTLFAFGGSLHNPYLHLLFYGLFMFHEVRDEAVIYQTCESVRPTKLLDAFSLAAAILFVTLLAIGYAVFLAGRAGPTGPPVGLWGVAAGLAAMTAWSMVRFLRLLGRVSLGHFLAEHRSLLVVYAGLLGLLALSASLGSIAFMVLVHVAGWLVFVHGRLKAKPGTTHRHLWSWLRSTPTGFLVLHLGLAAVLLALIAVRVHVWGRVGGLSEILASRNFCYWAIMHICMSFWSSR